MEISINGDPFKKVALEGDVSSTWASTVIGGEKYEIPRDVRIARILKELTYMRAGETVWKVLSLSWVIFLLVSTNWLATIIFGVLGVALITRLMAVNLVECEVVFKSGKTAVFRSTDQTEGEKLREMGRKVQENNVREFAKSVLKSIDAGIEDRQLTQAVKEQLIFFGLTQKSELLAIYEYMARDAISDGRIEPEELERLSRIQNLLGLPDAELPAEIAGDLAKLRTLGAIAGGTLPIAKTHSLITEKGEIVHWSEPARFLEETTTQGYKGGHQGFNVKISKSVNYRVAANRGKLVTERKIEAVDVGNLIVTSKRIVYAGALRAFTVRANSLASVECYANGVKLIEHNDKIRLIEYVARENAQVCNAIILKVASLAGNSD